MPFESRKQQKWYNATNQTFLDDEPHSARKVKKGGSLEEADLTTTDGKDSINTNMLTPEDSNKGFEGDMASVSGPPADSTMAIIDDEPLVMPKNIHMNENYIQDQFGVFYRPVYVGESYIPKDNDLIYNNKYYTTEGVGNCQFCQGAGKVTVEKLGLKDCPDCDGTGDIQTQPNIVPQGNQIPNQPIPQQPNISQLPQDNKQIPNQPIPQQSNVPPKEDPKEKSLKSGKRPDDDKFDFGGEAEEENWITMHGNHILVKKGQTKKQAVSDFLNSVDDDLKSTKKEEPKTHDEMNKLAQDTLKKYGIDKDYKGKDERAEDELNKTINKKSWDEIDSSEISDDTKKFSYKFVRSKHNTKGLSAKDVQIKNTKYDKLKNIDNEIWEENNFTSGKDTYSRDGMTKYKRAVAQKLNNKYDSIDDEMKEWLTDDNHHSFNQAVSELKAGIEDGEIEDWWDKANNNSRGSLLGADDTYKPHGIDKKYDEADSITQSAIRLNFVNRKTGKESHESIDQCPYCKSSNISTDKYGYHKCNDCDRGFDIPYEEPENETSNESFTKVVEACGCKKKAQESIDNYKSFINTQLKVLQKRAKAGEAVNLMYGLPTVSRHGRKIKGTLAYAGVSLNDRIYLPEELAKGHGMTLPLLLNHSSTAGAEKELDRLDEEMLDCLYNERDYKVGEVTLTWDPAKLTLFYEGVVDNKFFQKEIDDMDMAVSLGIYYDSNSPRICDESCYTVIKGAEFREVSLVYHAGFPIATIEAVEAELKERSLKAMEDHLKSNSFKDPTEQGNTKEQIDDFYNPKKEAEEELDILQPLEQPIDVKPKDPDEPVPPVVAEALTTTHNFSVRGVAGFTVSNSNGVERYRLDPNMSYETNMIHFDVTPKGAQIFGEEMQLQPKMTTPKELTKEIENKPDIKFTDSDEDVLKKN